MSIKFGKEPDTCLSTEFLLAYLPCRGWAAAGVSCIDADTDAYDICKSAYSSVKPMLPEKRIIKALTAISDIINSSLLFLKVGTV